MKPAPFEYARPNSVEQAIALLAKGAGDAKVLAGGQSLVPMMNFRLAQPRMLVDVNRIPGHDYIRVEGHELVIGFLARHEDIRRSELVAQACPLMRVAYQFVAHGSVRNRGTLCGNLCHADPSSEMPAVMLATAATMVLRGPYQTRRMSARDFFVGTYQTAARHDELLVQVRIPVCPTGQGFGFHEISTRKGDFAFVCMGALLTLADGRIARAALAGAGVGVRAIRFDGVEALLIGQVPSPALFEAAGAAARQAADPPSDVMASAEYRRDLVHVLTQRALADAARRAR